MADLIITDGNTIPVLGFTKHNGTSGEDVAMMQGAFVGPGPV